MRPSLYDYAGGAPAFAELVAAMHQRCLDDPELNHPFTAPDQHPQHLERLAAYWAQVLGGPDAYPADHSAMLTLHAYHGDMSDLGRRFVDCFILAMDDAGWPEDPDFRAVMTDYIRASTAEVLRYPDADTTPVPQGLAMPRWSWGGPDS